MYNYTGNNLPPISTPGGGGGTGAPVFPVTSGLPSTWQYVGCYVYVFFNIHFLRRDSYPASSDNANGRVMQTTEAGNPNNTVELCISECSSQNFTVAGVEFSVGDSISLGDCG